MSKFYVLLLVIVGFLLIFGDVLNLFIYFFKLVNSIYHVPDTLLPLLFISTFSHSIVFSILCIIIISFHCHQHCNQHLLHHTLNKIQMQILCSSMQRSLYQMLFVMDASCSCINNHMRFCFLMDIQWLLSKYIHQFAFQITILLYNIE